MPKISVIMASYNRGYLLKDILQSILDCKRPKGWDIEMIIVDDHSNKETWGVLKEFKKDSRFTIVRNKKNVGSAPQNWNKAFKMATGDVILITADDMFFSPNYFMKLYKESKKHDKYTIVVGIFINVKELGDFPKPSGKLRSYDEWIHPLTGIPYHPTDGSNEHVVTTITTGWCYREIYEGLDEFMYDYPVNGMSGETDQRLQIQKLSPPRKIVVVPDAVRYHIHNKVGGYRMDVKYYKKWTRINHRTFLRRNFGWKAYYMIPLYHLFITQKFFRDIIGKNIIEPMREKKK